MAAKKSLRERIRDAEDTVKARMHWRDVAKRRLDKAEGKEERKRRLEVLEERREALDKARERLAALRKEEKRRDKKDDKVIVKSGAPHWGGSEDIIANEVVPVAKAAGVAATSGKRTETFGNPGSDHHVSQVVASARDFATANNYTLRDKIMRALGVNQRIQDYGSYYITRAGKTFRVQPIAGTHGTGPHLHVGVELVG